MSIQPIAQEQPTCPDCGAPIDPTKAALTIPMAQRIGLSHLEIFLCPNCSHLIYHLDAPDADQEGAADHADHDA